MRKDFNDKLKKYKMGHYTEDEREEIEKEMEKVEIFQAFIDEQLQEDGLFKDKNEKDKVSDDNYGTNKILKKSKWKARLQNALVALVIIGIISSLFRFVTHGYYHGGSPPRWNILGNTITSSYAVTSPNLFVRREKFSTKPYFTADWKGYFEKQVGYRYYRAGEVDVSFQFSNTEYPKVSWFDIKPIATTNFRYPDPTREYNYDRGWEPLRILPEGTVAETYISFSQLLETDEVLQRFKWIANLKVGEVRLWNKN